MPTAIPAGPFLWRAQVTGDLCNCAVDWAWTFTPADGFDAAPPHVVPCGRYVLVTATADVGASSPAPVSPGVLELIASVTCGEDTTALDPIWLTLTEDGVSGYAQESLSAEIVMFGQFAYGGDFVEAGRGEIYLHQGSASESSLTGYYGEVFFGIQFSDGSWADASNVSNANLYERTSALWYPSSGMPIDVGGVSVPVFMGAYLAAVDETSYPRASAAITADAYYERTGMVVTADELNAYVLP